MVRLLLVDDHAGFRSTLARLLHRPGDLEVVAEAGTVAGALALQGHCDWDVGLVDLSMDEPDSGLELLRDLLRQNPRARILILTMDRRRSRVRRLREAGAAGYLLKSSRLDAIEAAVRSAAAGQEWVESPLRASPSPAP